MAVLAWLVTEPRVWGLHASLVGQISHVGVTVGLTSTVFVRGSCCIAANSSPQSDGGLSGEDFVPT
jgi:hypothetical protein